MFFCVAARLATRRQGVFRHLLPSLPPVLRVYEGCSRGYIGAVEGANIIKLNRRTPKISYLSYPEFERQPHPALTGALVVHLQTFDVRHFDYRDAPSPPILHRKEASIGTRDTWDQRLTDKGVRLAGHRVLRRSSSQPSA